MLISRFRARSAAAVVLAAGAAVLASALPAAAHITVNPSTAEQGGFGKFAFRVSNERPVPTTKVEVNLPVEHPIPFVSVRPLPGWTAAPVKTKLAKPIEAHGEQYTEAVTKITWTGSNINPGEFQEFEVSLGPLPKDAPELVFKALQTYASGEVVRWIQIPQEGQEEPEHPAPILKLTPASGDSHGGASPSTGTATPAGTEQTERASNESAGDGDGSDPLARWLGGLGLLVGLAGVAVAALARRRRTP